MNILHTLGLMTRKEHERIVQAEILQSIKAANRASDEKGFRFKAEKRADDFEAKFKRAATDLAAQSVKAADLALEVARLKVEREKLVLKAERNFVDAEAMRKKRAADRKRMAGKMGKDNG